jgi:hypothetical protein
MSGANVRFAETADAAFLVAAADAETDRAAASLADASMTLSAETDAAAEAVTAPVAFLVANAANVAPAVALAAADASLSVSVATSPVDATAEIVASIVRTRRLSASKLEDTLMFAAAKSRSSATDCSVAAMMI